MISVQETEALHTTLIEKFGGSKGIRDAGALESALLRPFQSFGGTDLYPGVLEKASALIESILNNHPFIDGNKRTGYVLTVLFLLSYNYELIAGEGAKYEFVIDVASGSLRYDQILEWIQKHTLRTSNQ